MSADEKGDADAAAIAFPISSEDLNLEFRVLASGGRRRGIRLERAVWAGLRALAGRAGTTPSRYVAALASAHPDASNLTALVRVACLDWLRRDNERLSTLASMRMVDAILAASPAPGFALSRERRIVAFNAPFQLLVRRRFADAIGQSARLEPRLALDVAIADIAARLEETDNQPVRTGFVIGIAERRFRGVLNAVRAPCGDEALLLAFVDTGERGD